MNRATRLLVAADRAASLALALRLIGLRYGLPAVYNPDEVAIMSRALGVREGRPQPAQLPLPDVLLLRAVRVGRRLLRGRCVVTGARRVARARSSAVLLDPTGVYVAGRAARRRLRHGDGRGDVYRARRRASPVRVAGAAAALFLAVAPLHVRDSHYVKHDVPVTLVIVARLSRDDGAAAWPGEAGERHVRGRLGGDAETLVAGAVTRRGVLDALLRDLPRAAAGVGCRLRRRAAAEREVLDTSRSRRSSSAVVFFALSPFLLARAAHRLRDIRANRQIVVDRAVGDAGLSVRRVRYAQMLLARFRRHGRSSSLAVIGWSGCCVARMAGGPCCCSRFRAVPLVHREHRRRRAAI